MRTTIKLDDDVARAVDALRKSEGLGVSAAVNRLARRGLTLDGEDQDRFTQRVSDMGMPRIPLDNIGDALEILEGEGHNG